MKYGWLPLLLLLATPLSAWEGAVEIKRAPAPVVIDGELEEAWLDHAPPHDLSGHDGRSNNLIVENYLTMFRSMYDDDCWYLAFSCSDDAPIGTLTERDAPIYQEEMCELMFQDAAGRYYYELSVSPIGTVYDARLQWSRLNRIVVDPSWNFQGLRCAAKKVPDGSGRCVWTVEIAIPWSSIPGGRPQEMRANALRFKRIKDPRLRKANGDWELLAMNLFPTMLRGWPQGPSTFGRFLFR